MEVYQKNSEIKMIYYIHIWEGICYADSLLKHLCVLPQKVYKALFIFI